MSMDKQISQLRDIIRKLHATGDDGFEGLLAVILTEVTKTAFTLAKSGSQHGRDGQTTIESGSVVFEGKRYDDTIPKNEVLSKIAELGADDTGDTDLWILGATAPVRSQDIDLISAAGKRVGIGTLILDWSATALPFLAVLMAAVPTAAAAFIAPRTGMPELDILSKLDTVRHHGQFSARSKELLAAIKQPSIGPAYALKGNEAFLKNAFSDSRRARAVFGQALAPGDTKVPGILDRTALRQSLAKFVFGTPDGQITVVLGADGSGKSWLFAQSWLAQTPKPLTVILVPDDIKEPFDAASIETLLVSALITQTGDDHFEVVNRRWRRHFARWKRAKTPDCARLVVLLDGLNQRESVHWAKVVNTFSLVVRELGGNLVLSCRTPFYRTNLKDRLLDPVRSVEVPEWTNPELKELLSAQGAVIDELRSAVVESLRNPRLFAIAAGLLQTGKIEAFTELSVSRLLFEHIRAGASPTTEPLSTDEFIRGIREHAKEIIDRLRKTDRDDLRIFARPSRLNRDNWPLSEQLAVISEGRFFEQVPGDATSYILKDESLPLALGLSLLSESQRALRNNLDVSNALSPILDPISALDNTAEVLISALIAAVLASDAQPELIAALVKSYVSLQNLDSGRFAEFRALARQATPAFLQALENAALDKGVTANLSWLVESLSDNSHLPHCWLEIGNFAQRWLSMYSCAPDRLTHGHYPPGSDEREKECQERKIELDAKLASFSQEENDILSSLVQEERGDYTRLNKIAFQLLAGKPLAQFAEAFRNWGFAAAFNGGLRDAHDEFDTLIRFNRIDWETTRTAMHEAATMLREPCISASGRWALVYALRATGASADAEEADYISKALTEGRRQPLSWRLVEHWCATDPCDPTSERPDNISVTAGLYKSINVAGLKTAMGGTGEDHFFDGARAGLVRFEPDAAISCMRRFAADAVMRDNAAFGNAAFFLASHTAALDDSSASTFVSKAAGIATDAITEEDKHKELFVASQYGLMIAFPHMVGNQQLAELMAYPRTDTILLSLCDLMQAGDIINYEEALERAYMDGDTGRQYRLMVFAMYTQTEISGRARAIIRELVVSPHKMVRLTALGVVCRLDDPVLLQVVVDCGWTAHALDAVSERFEIWYGSHALTLAAGKNLISLEDCCERIDFTAYLSLIRKTGRMAVPIVGMRINAAIDKATDYPIPINLPDIEQLLPAERHPIWYDVKERRDPDESMHNVLSRAAETGNAWYERRMRLRERVEKFEQELTSAGAQLVMQAVSADLIKEIYKEMPEIVRSWHTTFMALDQSSLERVHNIALYVAQIISTGDPSGSANLFERLSLSKPVVHVTIGEARISLEAVAVWRAADDTEIRNLQFKRLDGARNDHELANEVLAALEADKLHVIRDYVLERRTRPEPAHIARAIMVAGLCDDTPWAIETVDNHKNDHGFLAQAYAAAKFAMERLEWSKHWARMMGDAANETELWRYAVLLTTIVDGRFRSSELERGSNPDLIRRYGPSFNDLVRRQIGKWRDKRGKTLFGSRPPHEMFLT